MSAYLGDSSLLKGYNTVGIGHGGQSVGNDEAGAPLNQTAERFLHKTLSVGIHIRGGFIQYQDGRISQDCPRKTDKLALPSTEVATSFPHWCVVAMFQVGSESMSACRFGCFDDFLVAGPNVSISNIVLYTAGKEEGVLMHNAYLVS